MFSDLYITYNMQYFFFLIQLLILAKSKVELDSDPHWFGALDPDPQWGKKLDLDLQPTNADPHRKEWRTCKIVFIYR